MATLPRSPIANNVTNNYRPVAQARASGADPVGQALGNAGDAGFEIASRMADAKIATQAAQVELELENRLDQERRALEDDNEVDPASLEAMFQERASKAVSEIGGKITSPALKRAFGMKSAETVQRNTFQVRDVSRRKQVDLARGEFVTTMDAYSKTYDEPSNYLTPKGYDTSPAQDRLASQQSLISAQMKAGVITAETAAEQSIKAQDAYALGLQNKHLKAIDDALESGDYSGADSYFMANSGDFTTPEMREKTRDIIQTKRREGESITVADDIWTKSGENYDEFLRLIREDPRVKGTDMLTAVEARGATRKGQTDAAKAAKDARDLEAGMQYVVEGKAVPAAIEREMSPIVRDRIQAEERTRQLWAKQMANATAEGKALANQTSRGNYYRLKAQLNDPELAAAGFNAILADPALNALYENMSPDEQGQFYSDATAAAKNGGAVTDSVSKAYKSVSALAGAYMPANLKPGQFDSKFKGVGEGDPGVKRVTNSRKKSDAALVFEGELLGLVEQEVQRTGNPEIPADRAKQLVALAYAAAGEKKDGSTAYPIAPDVAGGIISTEARRTILDFRSQNPDVWSTTATLVRSKYPDASDAVVLEEARRIAAYRDAERIAGNLRGMFGAAEEE